ncbi:hypothetical protein PV325_008607 [Microctonus aethiopoides]|nr:hypothetical protein PV325_008607 [Microctonus aethiopoides]
MMNSGAAGTVQSTSEVDNGLNGWNGVESKAKEEEGVESGGRQEVKGVAIAGVALPSDKWLGIIPPSRTPTSGVGSYCSYTEGWWVNGVMASPSWWWWWS